MMKGIQAIRRIQEHPLAAFFILTYLISWGCWSLLISGVPEGLFTSLYLLSQFGPFISALAVSLILGVGFRDWLSSLSTWRASWQWYVLALAIPVAILTLSSMMMYMVGIDVEMNEVWSRLPSYVPMLIMITLIAGLGEEPGWRGFALPRLQRMRTPIESTLILGLGWSLWHAPLLLLDQEFASMGISNPWLLTAVALTTMVMIASLAFIYTWMYNSTGSLVVMMILHGSITTANQVLLPLSYETSHGSQYPLILLIITTVIIIFDAIIIHRTQGRLGMKD